jgi:hypothetical protein
VGLIAAAGRRQGDGTRFDRRCSSLAGSGDGRRWLRRGSCITEVEGEKCEGQSGSERGGTVKLTVGGGWRQRFG